MSPIPPKVIKAILADSYYRVCSRKRDGHCEGRITFEHTIIYAGKQLQEVWAIIPLCSFHHAVDQFQDCGDLQKEKNVWIALNRATDHELARISKAVNYLKKREVLNSKYGKA